MVYILLRKIIEYSINESINPVEIKKTISRIQRIHKQKYYKVCLEVIQINDNGQKDVILWIWQRVFLTTRQKL